MSDAYYPKLAPTASSSCRYCGSPRIDIVRNQQGPHFAVRRCANCGRWNGFVPRPKDRTWALGLRLWFGKYKNLTIEEILEIDRPYVVWLADTNGRASLAARVAVEGGAK